MLFEGQSSVSTAGRMPGDRFRHFVLHLFAFSLVSLGFMQISYAGVISTGQAVQADARQQRVSELEAFIARDDVAAELEHYGVAPETVMARVDSMTDTEIAELQGQIDTALAGGDALAVIGIVFLVLLILEVVGVTDIFKSV